MTRFVCSKIRDQTQSLDGPMDDFLRIELWNNTVDTADMIVYSIKSFILFFLRLIHNQKLQYTNNDLVITFECINLRVTGSIRSWTVTGFSMFLNIQISYFRRASDMQTPIVPRFRSGLRPHLSGPRPPPPYGAYLLSAL